MTELPYSVEVLIATLAAFNEAWWPVIATGLGAALWLLYRLSRADPPRPRLVLLAGAGIAAAAGGPYWLSAMAALDFMAPVYGGLWLLQAALLLFLGLRGGDGLDLSATFRWRAAIVAAGVFLYPILFWAETGTAGLGVPLAGSAPEPTAIVLIGLLAGGRSRRVLAALAIPAAWAGIAGFNGHLLGLFTPRLVAATLLGALATGGFAHRRRHDP